MMMANKFVEVVSSMNETAGMYKEEVRSKDVQALVIAYKGKPLKGGVYAFPDGSKVKLKGNKARVK